MHDHDTTPGSLPPDVDERLALEQVLLEAAKELPAITLAGCMTVAAEVLPFAIGRLRPRCFLVTEDGFHQIPTQFVWKDLENNEIYCHLRCAAIDAIDRAKRIADEIDSIVQEDPDV